MKMNAELRHKQNVLQAQLKSTVERKADMEADLKEKTKEIENLQTQMDKTNSNSPVRTALKPLIHTSYFYSSHRVCVCFSNSVMHLHFIKKFDQLHY